MTQNKPTDKAPGQASRRQQRLALRFRAAHITGPGIDAIGLVNDLWLAEDKEATRRKNGENLPTGARRLLVQQQRQQASRRSRNPVQYQHGVTRPGTPPELLRAEVELKGYAHSRVLNRNMKAAGVTRPTSVPAQCVHAHHTVAHGEWNARFSRDLLIGWGIGINDVDNGVHLPANKNTFVPELPNATKHMSVHTQRYHLMVFDRLNQANASDPLDGRAVLREIGGELLNDTFPYRPGILMTIWEVKAGPVDPWTPVVLPGEIDDPIKIAQFKTNGQPKTWSERPRLEFSVEKRKKKPTPRSDVIPFTSGGLVINTKAYAAFGSFLSQFGQILEFDLEDETGYFFNPTLLISCIDKNYRGIFAPRQMYPKSVFLEGTIPAEPVIFKDTASSFTSSIYINDAGKQILEELAKANGITGLMFPRADITVAEAEALLAAQRERAAAVAAAEARIRENAVPTPTILVLHAIEAAQLQRLLDDPESVTEAILGHGKDGQGVTDYLELGELWHAIHFMLNGDADFDTEGPLGRAVLGAEEIEHTEISCSHPLLVRQTASALQVLAPELFAERFDAAAMAAEDVYPDGRWEGENAIGIDAILPVYEKLRAFYAAAAQRGDAVLSSDL